MTDVDADKVKNVLIAMIGEEKYRETERMLHELQKYVEDYEVLARKAAALEEQNKMLRQRLSDETGIALAAEQALREIQRKLEYYEHVTGTNL